MISLRIKKKFKVVLVEDDLMYAKSMEHFLSRNFEIDIDVFNTGKEAIFHLQNTPTPPDLILLDFNLGDMDSDEIVEFIKKKKIRSKIIVVSGQTNKEVVSKLYKMGIFEYLPKGDFVTKSISTSMTYLLEKYHSGNNFFRFVFS